MTTKPMGRDSALRCPRRVSAAQHTMGLVNSENRTARSARAMTPQRGVPTDELAATMTYLALNTACTGVELPKFLKSFHVHTTFFAGVTSINCGLSGPAW